AGRDPRRGCGTGNRDVDWIGERMAYGYQYGVNQTAHKKSGFSFADFGKEVLSGAVTGGLASAAFYGAGKAVQTLAGSIWSKGSDEYNLYRKTHNTGEFKDLEELMQIKHIKNVANEAGIGLEGIKLRIDRNSELLGRGVYGYTDGKTITLYPDAFANTETLVKTLGHERVHVYQVEIFGKPLSTDILSEFERGASISEQSWWKYFEYKNGG
ncbi:MAG: hypothetical protein K2N55_00540, partial [Lachnospiraceae bacterium]|nr:hypothetical protein [Lachnospiraceae bacterium]